MYEIKGIQIAGLNNIPRNISSGYGNWDCGKIHYPNGGFAIYANIAITGSDGKPLVKSRENVSGFTAEFQELPCDTEGNILMDSYALTTTTHEDWPRGPDFIQLMIFCKKEPTHRVKLATGEIINNDSDNQYLRSMVYTYIIFAR